MKPRTACENTEKALRVSETRRKPASFFRLRASNEIQLRVSQPVSRSSRAARAAVSLFGFARAASAAATGALLFFGWRRLGFSAAEGLSAAIPFLLVMSAGGILNDYYDRDRDAVDKPWRPIPAGLVPASSAAACSIVLFAAAALAAQAGGYTPLQRALFWTALAGAAFYNVVVRHAGVLKAPYVGAISAVPVGVLLESSDLPSAALCAATALFVGGRELLMDVLDVRGDLAKDSRTVPMYLGPARGAALGFGLQIAGLAVFTTAMLGRLTATGATMQVVIWTFSLACAAAWVAWPERRRLVIYAMWAPLLAEMAVVVRAL